MTNIEAAVAANAKRLRRERRLTLEDAAQRSGISRSMISQIENGAANPTVALLANLAAAYRVTLMDFLAEPEADVKVVRSSELAQEAGPDETVRFYPIFQFDPEKRFEVYRGEAEPGAERRAKGHSTGSTEFLILVEGTLSVTAAGVTTQLEAGDSLRFTAADDHVYCNPGKSRAVFLGMVSYGVPEHPEGVL